MLKVDVYERLTWECPVCCEENSGPSWLNRGDKVKCEHCGEVHKVCEHYADCRPAKVDQPVKSK